MSIVSAETPRCSISASALVRVRWVVPKPGIVRPWIVPAVEAEHVAGRDRDQKRQRGIQAAGDAEIERRVRRKLFDSLGQSRALDAEDLGAAAVELGALRRHERRARHLALQALHRSARANRNPAERLHERRAVVEAGRDAAIGEQLGDVDILGDRVRVAANRLAVADPRRLGQQPAVLGDQAMAAENDVGRRFGRPAAGHRIGGDRTARLAHDEIGAVLALADRLVAGRKVEQDGRPGHGLERAGGHGHPEVLADLDAHDDAATVRHGRLLALASNKRSMPKGTRWPPSSISAGSLPAAGLNQRLS